MKKIEAIFKEEYLEDVKDALEAEGFIGMTVFPVKGRGSKGGIQLQWRAGPYHVDFLHKVLLMIIVNDGDYRRVTDTIVRVCGEHADPTGGAGRIFVSTVDEAIRIRTGEVETTLGKTATAVDV